MRKGLITGCVGVEFPSRVKVAGCVRILTSPDASVDAVLASAVTDWRARLAQWDPDDIRTLTYLLHRLTEATNDPEAGEGSR